MSQKHSLSKQRYLDPQALTLDSASVQAAPTIRCEFSFV